MTIRREKWLWSTKLALIAIGTTMIGLVLSRYILCLVLGSAPHRFHQWEWRLFRGEGMAGSPRKQMGEDLIAHHLHKGMTRKEVDALLGPSESPLHSSNCQEGVPDFECPGPHVNGYWVGDMLWPYALYVGFDAQDRMTYAYMKDED